MTKREWQRRQRIKFALAGKCRCGGKRMPGHTQCERCVRGERERRAKLRELGVCMNCKCALARAGATWCLACRERVNTDRRGAMKLWRALYPKGRNDRR